MPDANGDVHHGNHLPPPSTATPTLPPPSAPSPGPPETLQQMFSCIKKWSCVSWNKLPHIWTVNHGSWWLKQAAAQEELARPSRRHMAQQPAVAELRYKAGASSARALTMQRRWHCRRCVLTFAWLHHLPGWHESLRQLNTCAPPRRAEQGAKLEGVLQQLDFGCLQALPCGLVKSVSFRGLLRSCPNARLQGSIQPRLSLFRHIDAEVLVCACRAAAMHS